MVTPWLRLLLAGSILVPATVLGVNAFQSHSTAQRHADARITSTVRLLREQAAKVLETNALTLAFVDKLLGDQSWQEISTSPTLHDELHRWDDNLPHVSSIVVARPDGLVVNASQPLPPEPIHLTDRAHFIALRDGTTELYITPVYRGRVSHELQFSFAKRRTSKDGEFNGMIVVSDSSSYFFHIFEEAAIPDMSITLALDNGKILASWPESTDGEIPPALLQQLPADKMLLVSADSMIKHVPARIGLERVGDYPFVVAFSIADSHIYAGWRHDMLLDGLISSFGIGCVVITGLIAMRAYRRSQDTYVQLEDEMERRRMAEIKMHHTQRMEALGQLTAGVAHDFNNMLTVIVGNVEQIATLTKDKIIKQKVERVLNAATRGATLAAHMLTFSRRQMLHTERCDLNQEIINISPLFESSIGDCNKLKIVVQALPVFCTLDRSEFTLAVMNIANNAAQAMHTDGTLTVTIGSIENCPDLPLGQYACITMEDTGEGMSDEVKQRAFEPFFTTRDLTIGTGLGLSQVYGFAKQCGGDVMIESKLTEGTKITLYLPMNDPKVKFPTILVVDDSSELLEILGPSLESNGYIALCTNNPHEAIRLVDNHTIALLLTDMVMPEMSGTELVDRVVARQPAIKVLFMTGYSSQTAATYPVLRKPFRLHELVDRVKQTLGESPGRWT